MNELTKKKNYKIYVYPYIYIKGMLKVPIKQKYMCTIITSLKNYVYINKFMKKLKYKIEDIKTWTI